MGHFGLTLEKEGSKSGMVTPPRGEPSARGGEGGFLTPARTVGRGIVVTTGI